MHVSLVPRPPHLCSSVCIQYSTRKWNSSKKRRRPGLIYNVNDVRLIQSGHMGGGRGIITKLGIRLSTLPQSWMPDVSVIETILVLTSKKTHFQAYFVHIRISAPSPYVHLVSTHVPRFSPFFSTLLGMRLRACTGKYAWTTTHHSV